MKSLQVIERVYFTERQVCAVFNNRHRVSLHIQYVCWTFGAPGNGQVAKSIVITNIYTSDTWNCVIRIIAVFRVKLCSLLGRNRRFGGYDSSSSPWSNWKVMPCGLIPKRKLADNSLLLGGGGKIDPAFIMRSVKHMFFHFSCLFTTQIIVCKTFLLIYLPIFISVAPSKKKCSYVENVLGGHLPPLLLVPPPQVNDCGLVNIIIIIIIIYLSTAIGLSPGGSGYFTCIQNMKLVTTGFKSGGLHEKHVVANWNLGNHLSICF